MKIYFSDFFETDPDKLEDYGAFNISLINDLPLFIDPFLLFGSSKPEYQNEHNKILKYLSFLKEKAENGLNNGSTIQAWYVFKEVKQNWFGYSKVGNSGSGLGRKFGKAFSSTIHLVFDDLGKEQITQSSHLEKAGLFQIGVGKDNISDFTTNLLKEFLLNYTETFAKKEIDKKYLKKVNIERVYFDYKLERWMPKEFILPCIVNDFVILTPKDILTKDENWINSNDLRGDFTRICTSISNEQLRGEIFNYFRKILPAKKPNEKYTQKEQTAAIQKTILKFPEIIKFYVKEKEENKKGAKSLAEKKVEMVDTIFVKNVSSFVELLLEKSDFYQIPPKTSFEEAMKRVVYLKDVIEKNDGYKLFYIDGEPIKREADLQIIYKLTWFASDFDVNREPNNGRGPVDYSVSKGSNDKTVVEFKLASNSKIRQNLENQVKIYKEANNTKNGITAILYFDTTEYNKVKKVIGELGIKEAEEFIILIDGRPKKSASNVK